MKANVAESSYFRTSQELMYAPDGVGVKAAYTRLRAPFVVVQATRRTRNLNGIRLKCEEREK
jgi:hypothetical protein